MKDNYDYLVIFYVNLDEIGLIPMIKDFYGLGEPYYDVDNTLKSNDYEKKLEYFYVDRDIIDPYEELNPYDYIVLGEL